MLSEFGFVHQRIHHAPEKQLKHERQNSPLWPQKRIRGKDLSAELFTKVNYICIQKNYFKFLVLREWKLEDTDIKSKSLLKL